ncbi:hypothetical protein [Nonomuraea gerenzanensis]|uniref:Uncharacterized protein n=1 Tax=Nonomuraea gerenzanensis TaxID=93944 RepID=A0A1M4ENY8_9ACTN|nr:hypothetical protein [Nonomuraea gerenzanensis]UBU12010.1 hypothetical protein LCN96_48235 [Nonomuraea gerenzanensis]SBP00525.1 hypothetical protein BN4615_P10041 [Nonomuraea gerenzanensis]
MSAETYETSVVAGPGGVMTEEVGVITGEVTVRTVVVGERVTVRVQYLDADEWYEIEGSPLAPATDPGPRLHQEIVQAVRRGIPHGLTGFPPPV